MPVAAQSAELPDQVLSRQDLDRGRLPADFYLIIGPDRGVGMRRGDMDGQLMRRAIQQIAVSIAQIEHGCDRCGPNAGCRGFRSDCQLLCSEADGDLHTCLKALGIDFAKVDPATGHVDGRSTIRIAYDRCLDQVGFAHELGDKPGPRVAIDLVGCPELLKLAPCRVALKGALPQSVWRTILRTGRFRRDSDDFKEALVARERCFRSKR